MRESLLRFLERERLGEERASRELRSLPLGERVECGEAIAGLVMISQGRGTYVLKAPEHHAKFREGDLLWLGDGNEVEAGARVRLVTYDAVSREIAVEHDDYQQEPPIINDKTLVLDRRSMATGERFASAVHELFSRPEHPIVRCIEGRLESDDNEKLRRAFMKIARTRGLDPSQSDAFARALARPKIHLIQGPPGTGKTRLIAEIIDECFARGERVAAVAYTHRAVDQVLIKAAERCGRSKLYKFDAGRAGGDELKAAGVRAVRGAERLMNVNDLRIVGMTTHAAARAAPRGVRFDRVIFDEAAQIPIPHAVASMRLADRWLFVGDHAQLPPVTCGEHRADHSLSIFGHLVDKYPSTMLETTYRMNAGICDFPSRHFYGGRLAPSAGAAARKFGLKPGGRFINIFDPERACVLVEVDHRGAAMRSRREAAIAAELLLEAIVHHRVSAEECAAVAPFRAQVMAIREQLERRAAARSVKFNNGLPLIETVERIQGREKELIVFSLASSDPDWLASQGEFYYMPNRLNVALTRARTKCIILASPLAFEARPRQLSEVANMCIFRALRSEILTIDAACVEREIPA